MTRSTGAENRIRRVLASKNDGAADYWRARGRERFGRELAEDGVPRRRPTALLDTIEGELFPPGWISTSCSGT
jgi:hypothetical protein